MNDILRLRKELEKAVLRNDIEKADKISDQLFRIQGGMESDTVMPAQFVDEIIERSKQKSGGQKSMNMKKFISIVAIAAVTAALGITALAARWYGISLVFKDSGNEAAITENSDISDSATDVEASTDGYVKEKADSKPVLSGINGSNEYTEKYPLYLVYTKEMAENCKISA